MNELVEQLKKIQEEGKAGQGQFVELLKEITKIITREVAQHVGAIEQLVNVFASLLVVSTPLGVVKETLLVVGRLMNMKTLDISYAAKERLLKAMLELLRTTRENLVSYMILWAFG